MSRTSDIKASAAAVKDACERGDLEWFKDCVEQESGLPTDEHVVEMVMHMTTLMNLGVSESKRRDSQRWLAARGVRDTYGLPITANGPLPSRFDGGH